METVLFALLSINTILLAFAIILIAKRAAGSSTESHADIEDMVSQLGDTIHDIGLSLAEGQQQLSRQTDSARVEIVQAQNMGQQEMQKSLNQMDKEISRELSENLGKLQQANDKKLTEMLQAQSKNAAETQKLLSSSSEASIDRLHQMEKTVTHSLNENLERIRNTNEQKMAELQKSVNEKLDKSLNERLDTSFSKVTEQLGELYKSLGELGKMSSDISSLNRSLSNVKIRGTWGEAQLRDIIVETMTPSQYEENVITKQGSNDPVEFAIKIPSKENGNEYILLPIDSKFPMDRYNEVIDAAEVADKTALNNAIKQLELRIKSEAIKIRDKYISVPTTTNFAVMYLPTESLYAEVLRINGLAELCQNKYGIIIAGPTTITALLNSLRVGFQNLTLSKKTDEIRKLLVAVKMQFSKMDELILQTQKKLEAASNVNEKLAKRSGLIQKKLAKISTDIPEEEKALLQDPGGDNSILALGTDIEESEEEV